MWVLCPTLHKGNDHAGARTTSLSTSSCNAMHKGLPAGVLSKLSLPGVGASGFAIGCAPPSRSSVNLPCAALHSVCTLCRHGTRCLRMNCIPWRAATGYSASRTRQPKQSLVLPTKITCRVMPGRTSQRPSSPRAPSGSPPRRVRPLPEAPTRSPAAANGSATSAPAICAGAFWLRAAAAVGMLQALARDSSRMGHV